MTTTEATDLSHREASQFAGPLARLVLLMAILCGAQGDTLLSMIDIWWNTTTYNHGFLVLPVSLYLIWRRRDEVANLALVPSPSALLPLAAFSIVWLIGEISGVNLARHVGFVGSLMALFPLALGWDFARRFRFAILFLAFMVPFGDFLIPALQELTADVSVWMLVMSGVPVYREGLMIELPTGLWEVAEACAGIRFLIANIFVAFVFAYLSYDRLWKWALFLILAVAIPVGANCIRAYGIMMVAHSTDNAIAAGVDHLVYGWVFFSLVMLLMLWVGGLFADRVIEDPKAAPVEASPARAQGGFGIVVAGLLVMAGGPALAGLTEPTAADLPDRIAERVIPGGWQVVQTDRTAQDVWIPRFDGADRIEQVAVTNGTHTVDIFIAAYTHQRDGSEALHWANRFDDDTVWKRARLGEGTLATGASGLPAEARIDGLTHYVMNEHGTTFSSRFVASWTMIDGTFHSDAARTKLHELTARLTGGSPKAAVLALSVQYARPEERHRARAAIEALLADSGDLHGLLD